MLKKIIVPVVALLMAIAPSLTAHASVNPKVVYGGLTFTSNASGNGCTGTLVGVYGSSALKNYVLGTAAAYCAQQLTDGISASNAVDVEYLGGGDSCPGVDLAADDTTDPVVGVSDVFVPGCTGAQARSSSLVKDNNSAVNIVDAITNCGSTVTSPQGGDPFNSALVQCLGSGVDAGNTCGAAQTFPFPSDISLLSSRLLWAGTLGDTGQINGCAGTSPAIQIRVPGSGTRATWCYNVYGTGVDNCNNTANTGPQGGSGGLVGAICGNPNTTPPTAPTDATGTIGHTSRATIVIDPNISGVGASDSLETRAPIQECGIVSAGGHSGYNKDCDPIKAFAGTAQTSTYLATDTNGVVTCKGDGEISDGAYQVWGYEHFDTSSSLVNSGATAINYATIYGPKTLSGTTETSPGGYLTYLLGNATQENRLLGFGFMRNCQMQVKRTTDAGPYALNGSKFTC